MLRAVTCRAAASSVTKGFVLQFDEPPMLQSQLGAILSAMHGSSITHNELVRSTSWQQPISSGCVKIPSIMVGCIAGGTM